jgi:hypothetical protein
MEHSKRANGAQAPSREKPPCAPHFTKTIMEKKRIQVQKVAEVQISFWCFNTNPSMEATKRYARIYTKSLDSWLAPG